jgi:hypothetical protein
MIHLINKNSPVSSSARIFVGLAVYFLSVQTGGFLPETPLTPIAFRNELAGLLRPSPLPAPGVYKSVEQEEVCSFDWAGLLYPSPLPVPGVYKSEEQEEVCSFDWADLLRPSSLPVPGVYKIGAGEGL